MSNEEKARELVNEYGFWDYRDRDCSIKSTIKMAAWKEQQFNEYIEKKYKLVKDKLYKICIQENNEDFLLLKGKLSILDEIINELFGETEQDNSDREE